MMSTFDWSDSNGLRILVSENGTDWTNYATGPAGLSGYLRDPSILQYGDKYFVAFTDAGHGGASSVSAFSIMSADKTNLNVWTTPVSIPTGVSGANTVWSPEFFVDDDGTVYVFVAVSSTGNTTSALFSIYAARALDSTLTSWSAFTQVYDSTRYPIDPFVVKKSGTYYLWYTNNNTGYVEYASSLSPTSGYTPVKTGNWAGWGNIFEGTSLVLLPGGSTWRAYLDISGWAGSGFDTLYQYYSDSTDNWATWSVPKPITSSGANHGTTILPR